WPLPPRSPGAPGRNCGWTERPPSKGRPWVWWGSCPWPAPSSPPTRCSRTPTSAGRSARRAGTTSWPSRTTNRPCCGTSRPPSPPTRPFPPYQGRRREAARTRATTLDKGHGRRERRTLVASTELTAYLRPDWPGLGQVCQVTRERWEEGRHTVEVAYRITSLTPERADARRLLALDR